MEDKIYNNTLNVIKRVRQITLYLFITLIVIAGVKGNILFWEQLYESAAQSGIEPRFSFFLLHYLKFLLLTALVLAVLFSFYILLFLRPLTTNKLIKASLYAIIASFCLFGAASLFVEEPNSLLTKVSLYYTPIALLIVFILTKIANSFLVVMEKTPKPSK